jgi:hypothetical protein
MSNPYVVTTGIPGAAFLKSIKKAVVGKTEVELQEQVDRLKEQRDNLLQAEKETVTAVRDIAQEFQAKIDRIMNERRGV